MIKIKATPEFIIEKLCQHGFDTYVVGGAVRDLIRGQRPLDEDIATSAKPDQIQKIFKDHKIATGGTYFKVTFVDGIEVATFRKDFYEGLSDKSVTVTYANDIFEDLARRDLTINAMAFCQFTGNIIDPYHGQDDLKKKVINFVGDPRLRIYEDPNRIIRACRFLATIDGVFSHETREALRKYSGIYFPLIAPERIHDEIMKAMRVREASAFFNALHEIYILDRIFPSLECCYEFQDLHGMHHWEPIITHSYLAGDSISTKYPLTKLAGYIHDIGKPKAASYNPKTQDLRFKGHDKEGMKLAQEELKDLTFSNDEISYITSLIRLHMNNFASPKASRRTLKKLADFNVPWKELYRLKLADSKANVKNDPVTLEKIRADFERIERAFNAKTPNKFTDLAINGKDIMEVTHFQPGPIIGEIKTYLLELTVDNPELNNRETLIDIMKEKYNA